jgi:hypothetical protein
MAFLEQFSAEEKEMLVSLPYRAGLWVSSADKTGSPGADDTEVATLEKIITDMGRGMFDSAFAHEVMAETFARRGDWKSWAAGLETVPDTCAKAVAVIAGKLGAHDLDGYRQNIMNIGMAVANAFREFDLDTPLPARVCTYAKLALDRLIGKLTGQEYESNDLLNVSYEEDVALAKLAKSLGIDAQSVEDGGGAEKKA